MNHTTLVFRGKRVDIEELVQALSELDGIEQVGVDNVSSVSANVLDRDPLRQFEVVDVAIAFTINLASAYVYDQIRSALRERAARKASGL